MQNLFFLTLSLEEMSQKGKSYFDELLAFKDWIGFHQILSLTLWLNSGKIKL